MANELGSKFLGQKYPELKTKILKNNTKKIPKTKKNFKDFELQLAQCWTQIIYKGSQKIQGIYT